MKLCVRCLLVVIRHSFLALLAIGNLVHRVKLTLSKHDNGPATIFLKILRDGKCTDARTSNIKKSYVKDTLFCQSFISSIGF